MTRTLIHEVIELFGWPIRLLGWEGAIALLLQVVVLGFASHVGFA